MSGNVWMVTLGLGWLVWHWLSKWKQRRERRKWLEGGTKFTDPVTGVVLTIYNDDGE